MSKCKLIICDGGSMQEESLIFQKPCIILRNATERPEGLASNFQFLSKLEIDKTKKKIEEFSNPKFKIKNFPNPYGKNNISKNILGVLRE
jgi:UDP-N-acetylglucosamine 2-epimerase (non-hydrolysing)